MKIFLEEVPDELKKEILEAVANYTKQQYRQSNPQAALSRAVYSGSVIDIPLQLCRTSMLAVLIEDYARLERMSKIEKEHNELKRAVSTIKNALGEK